MNQIEDNRIAQFLIDIQKYKKWGNLLAGQSLAHLLNSNIPISALTIHNGLEYIKAQMKLSVLQDSSHSEKEKDDRLEQIDIDIHHTEEIMKHDLEYRGMLQYP